MIMTPRTTEEILRDIRDALTGLDPRGCVGTEKAAKYLDVPVSTIRQWVRMRELPCFREGKRLLFRVRELDQWLERRRLGGRK